MNENRSTFKEKWTEKWNRHIEKKTEKKKARKKDYKSLDNLKKYQFWLKRAAILTILVLLAGVIWTFAVPYAVDSYYYYCLEQQASPEEILEIAQPDEEGAAAIDAMEQNSPEDTWAIYVYMCGSNLESFGENNLSEVSNYLLEEYAQAYSQEKHVTQWNYVSEFVSDINAQGMDLPAYMYLPEKPEDEMTEEENTDEDMSGYPGNASADIGEMLAVELPENVKIVFQTGGASRWSMTGVNPNRSQRFVYDSEGFGLVEEKPIQNMGNADTLADFLKFCKEDYSADHQMVVFWNHGGGAFGLCYDELYGNDMLSLKEMQDAFGQVYEKEEENPPFEIIGFDACLMATVETAEALHGYASYLVASEETEPGEGWDYTAWVGKLAENTKMNGAQVGKAIADSYIEYYANQSIQLDWLGVDYGCTFSVVDIAKAHEVYEAYGRLAASALKESFEYPAVMSALGMAASGSVRYADTSYKVYNMLDLGLFMDNLMELYPEEAGEVVRAVQESVIYNRTTSFEQDSQGLSVYFPAEIEDLSGLVFYLNYLNEICADEDVKALYYYKLAGCLNEEMQKYADSKGYGNAKILDTTSLEQLAGAEIEILENGNFSLHVDPEATALIQDYSMNLVKYDEKEDKVIYYGEDQFLALEEGGRLYTDFEGEWISINGHILSIEKIDSTESSIRYRAPVAINGEDSYLILAYDFETEQMSILGVRSMEESGEILTRNMNNIKAGDKLQAIYDTNTLDSDVIVKEYGKRFTYWSNSRVEDQTLENGTYLVSITITDTRGDEYYTPVVQFSMQSGKITDAAVREDLYNERTAD